MLNPEYTFPCHLDIFACKRIPGLCGRPSPVDGGRRHRRQACPHGGFFAQTLAALLLFLTVGTALADGPTLAGLGLGDRLGQAVPVLGDPIAVKPVDKGSSVVFFHGASVTVETAGKTIRQVILEAPGLAGFQGVAVGGTRDDVDRAFSGLEWRRQGDADVAVFQGDGWATVFSIDAATGQVRSIALAYR